MPSIPFCGQSYRDRSLDANAQACINLYPMTSPTPEDSGRIVLYPTPGYSLFRDTRQLGIAGCGAIRAAVEVNGVAYVASGSKLLKIDHDGTDYRITALGTLNTSTGRCSITCNTVELVISDRSYGYVHNLATGSFAGISGGGFPATGGVTNFTYQDGYVLAGLNASKRMIQSDIFAGGLYKPLAFAEAASFADNVTAIVSDQLLLYVFGPKLTEVRFNAGSSPFAFEKQQGVLIQAGTEAPDTIVKVGSTFIWLASDEDGKAYVAALSGYTPKVLSTPPINEAIERYATVSDAFAYSYREADNQFYCLTFPSANVTWAYDLKMNAWHQRSINGGRDLPEVCISWRGRRLVGDALGRLFWMGQEYCTDGDGNGLRRVRRTQHASADGRMMFLDELEILIESGVGLASGQGEDPLATLGISKDGGHTWHSLGTGHMGRLGEYRRRLLWHRLGGARRIALELVVTDPVNTVILGARAKIRAGSK